MVVRLDDDDDDSSVVLACDVMKVMFDWNLHPHTNPRLHRRNPSRNTKYLIVFLILSDGMNFLA